MNIPIKRVKGIDENGKKFIYGVEFMDSQGGQVCIYDPGNFINSHPGKEHHLGDNEELIGVYGSKDK